MKLNIYPIIVLTKFMLFLLFISCSIADAMSPGTEAVIEKKLTMKCLDITQRRPDKAHGPHYMMDLQKMLKIYREKTGRPGSFSELASTVSENWNEVQRTRPGM